MPMPGGPRRPQWRGRRPLVFVGTWISSLRLMNDVAHGCKQVLFDETSSENRIPSGLSVGTTVTRTVHLKTHTHDTMTRRQGSITATAFAVAAAAVSSRTTANAFVPSTHHVSSSSRSAIIHSSSSLVALSAGSDGKPKKSRRKNSC